MPNAGFFSATCLALQSESVWMGERPEFSARARGMLSRASANARNAYCSRVEICGFTSLTLVMSYAEYNQKEIAVNSELVNGSAAFWVEEHILNKKNYININIFRKFLNIYRNAL